MLRLPEAAPILERSFVLAQVIIDDEGAPEDPPAARLLGQAFERIAWARATFGIWLAIDPEGEHLIGGSGCQLKTAIDGPAFRQRALLDSLAEAERQLHRVEAIRRDVAAGKAGGKETLETYWRERNAWVEREFACIKDPRLFTARRLATSGWHTYLDRLRPRENSGLVLYKAEVREPMIRSIGTFLVDDRPFAPGAAWHLTLLARALPPEEVARMSAEAGTADGVDVTKVPVPPSLRRKAAVALSEIYGLGWDPGDPHLVAKARKWWRQRLARGAASR